MKKFYILLLAISLSGCSFQTHYQQNGSIIYEPISPENVEIHVGDVDREYHIIGVVAVDALGQGKQTREILKKKAASLGANAVINTELSKIGSAVARTGMSGIAIRYK